MVEKSISFLDKLYVAKSFNRVLPMALFQKKSEQGGWGYAISRGMKEIACGISRG